MKAIIIRPIVVGMAIGLFFCLAVSSGAMSADDAPQSAVASDSTGGDTSVIVNTSSGTTPAPPLQGSDYEGWKQAYRDGYLDGTKDERNSQPPPKEE